MARLQEKVGAVGSGVVSAEADQNLIVMAVCGQAGERTQNADSLRRNLNSKSTAGINQETEQNDEGMKVKHTGQNEGMTQ